MKFIRALLPWLVLAIAVVLFLVAAAFLPNVQTWVAQLVLAEQPRFHGSLESLSARFGKVEIAGLHLEVGGAVVTVPSLQARLPVTTAVWKRRILIRSLVAKGWTIDLSHNPKPRDAGTPSAPEAKVDEGAGPSVQARADTVKEVARVVGSILGGRNLPCDVSLDGVDLEGDVVIAGPAGYTPDRIHLIVKGGGMAAGHEGEFTLDAAGSIVDLGLPADYVAAHGRLVVAMGSPRTLSRIGIKTDLVAKGGTLSNDMTFSADFAAARDAGAENLTLDLSRDNRRLAAFAARISEKTRQLAGTWKVDLRDSDLALFAVNAPNAAIAVSGDGTFETDPAITRVRAIGSLNAVAGHLGGIAPSLEPLGPMTLNARFDLAQSGRSVRVDHLGLSLGGTRPVAIAQALQPFDLDERTGDLKLSNPPNDWMDVSILGLPLTWVSGLTGAVTFAGGDATGEFVVRVADGGFSLRSKTPIAASGVTVQSGGATVGQGLDVSFSLLADYAPQRWQVQWAPFTVDVAGRRLATIDAKLSRSAGADQPIAIAGTWSADLDALASQPAIHGVKWPAGHSASGDFSAKLGTATEVEGKLTVVGHDPKHSISASGQADVSADGTIAFLVPLKIEFGSSVSDLSAQGTWAREEAGARIYVEMTGKKVDFEHLRLLAAPLVAVGSLARSAGTDSSSAGVPAPKRAPDRTPFWGGVVGPVKLNIDRLRAGGDDWSDVSGTFDISHGSIHLLNGQGGLSKHHLEKVDGTITFDGTAGLPYNLKATSAVNEVDAATLFGSPDSGKEPVVEGRFSLATTFTGSGINLDDLFSRTQEEFRLTSTAGIVRLLKTRVGEAIPEAPSSRVSDALGAAGYALGSFFGARDNLGSGKIAVNKTTEAVLDFTYGVSEIGYDQVTVTAIRGLDQTIHLVELAMTAADERLTGTGQITYVQGRPLTAQPLSLTLQLGVHGAIAEMLAKTGLLSAQKDGQGFSMFNQPIHFGGTLEHIDRSEWHDLLVKAATRKPAAGEKSGKGGSP